MRGSKILILVIFWVFWQCQEGSETEARLEGLQGRERLAVILQLMEEYSSLEPQRAIAYGDEGRQLSIAEADRVSEGLVYKYLGDSNYYLQKLEESLGWYQRAVELVRETSGAQSMAYQNRLADVAYVLEMLNRLPEAISSYLEALHIAEIQQNQEEIIITLNNIGNCYYKLGEYEKAMEFLQRSLLIEEEYGSDADISIVLNSIGMVYQAWKETEKARNYYEQALEIDRKYGNEDRMAIRLNNLGYIYQEMKEYDKALVCLLEALELQKKNTDMRRLTIRYSNLSLLYIALGRFEEALECLREVEKYLQKYDDVEVMATYYENYGNYYFKQNRYKEALYWHLKRLKLTEEKELRVMQRSVYSDIYSIYEKLGNFEEAYKYQSRFLELQDSLFTEEKHRQIAELELKYESEKKEKEIELLRKNAELVNMQIAADRRMRNLLFLVLALALLSLFAFFLSYRHRQAVKRVLQEQKALRQSRLAILGEVAAGIVHEINQPLQSMSFTLENLSSALAEHYADRSYLEKKTGYLSEDVGRMQRIIDHIRTFSHNRSEEKKEPFNLNDSIRNALSMTQQRYMRQGIKIDLQLEEKLPSLMGNIFSFEQVILILLSNAQDAIEEKSQTASSDFQKKIYLHTQLRDKQVVVQVGDNGNGISEENLSRLFNPFFTTKEAGKGTGLGLAIAKGIIQDMGGSIVINSVPGKGTIINITFSSEGAVC